MNERRDATALARPRRSCPYCCRECRGRTCRACVPLGTGYGAAGNRGKSPPLDPHAYAERLPTMRDELREAVKGR